MSEDFIAILQRRRGRLPAVFEPDPQKLVRAGLNVEDGNCRDRAESGCIINQKQIFVRYDDVVREFILRHDLRHDLR